MFERNTSGTWVQVKKLEAPIRQFNDRFGYSVSISGDAIIVGAYHEDEGEFDTATMQNAGSAYLYTRTAGAWSFTQKIVASNRDVNDYFGYSVAIDNNHLIVGAYQYDPDSIGETGGAYAFELIAGKWTETKILRPLTPYKDDKFGWSVDLDGDFYIVGAPEHDYDLSGSVEFGAGAAFVFDAANSWGEIKIVHSDRSQADAFGWDVAIDGITAVVGTPFQDYDVTGSTFWSNAGATYVFEHSLAGGGSWAETQKLVPSVSDRFSNDYFGLAIDISGNNIIGGATGDNIDTPPTVPTVGAMYIFNKASGVGIADLEKTEYKLYPNPANEILRIEFVGKAKDYKVEITNVNGEVLSPQYREELNTLILDLSNFSAGLYFVVVQSNLGMVSSTKFLKTQ